MQVVENIRGRPQQHQDTDQPRGSPRPAHRFNRSTHQLTGLRQELVRRFLQVAAHIQGHRPARIQQETDHRQQH